MWKEIECPVCHVTRLRHDPELNCIHCLECNYQWWPSRDYSTEKRLITHPRLAEHLKNKETI